MPVHRLFAGHDLTCEQAYSGYEIANTYTPVQDAGKDLTRIRRYDLTRIRRL